MELLFTNNSMKLTPDEMAQILRTSPEKLKAFEKAYQVKAIDSFDENDVFGMDARTAVAQNQNRNLSDTCPDHIVDAIVKKLIGETRTIRFHDGKIDNCDWSPYGMAGPRSPMSTCGAISPARPTARSCTCGTSTRRRLTPR